MNNRFLHQYDVDLLKPRTRKALQSLLMSQDEMSDVFVISVYEGGAAVALEGTATAFVQRGDGNTVEETGTISGNTITIPLSEHSYYIPGVVIITVKLITQSASNSLIEINGTVRKSSTGNVIDPTEETVIRIEEVFQKLDNASQILDDVADATDAANDAVEHLDESIADIVLQQSTQPQSETNKIWFPSATPEGVEVPTFEEFSEVKSAIYTESTYVDEFVSGKWSVSNGNAAIDTKVIKSLKYFPTNYAGNVVAIDIQSGYEFSVLCWDGDTYMGSWTGSGFNKSSNKFWRARVALANIGGSSYKFALNVRNTDTTQTIDASEASNVLFISTVASWKLDKYQNVSESGRVMQVSDDGEIVPGVKIDDYVPSQIKISGLSEMSTGEYIQNVTVGTDWTTKLVTGSGVYLPTAIDISKYIGDTITIVIGGNDSHTGVRQIGFCNSSNIASVAYKEADLEFTQNGEYLEATIPITDTNMFFSLSTKSYLAIYVNSSGEIARLIQNDVAFVSVNGSDDNSGIESAPFATVNHALESGARTICVKGGIYEQQISLKSSKHGDISIVNATPTEKVVFVEPGSLITDTETLVSGYTKVYSATVSKSFSTGNKWIFQDGVPDSTTEITAAKRMPEQRGLAYRCYDTKIEQVSADNLSDALLEIENSEAYKWYIDGTTLYFSRPETVTANNPIRGSFNKGLFSGYSRKLSLHVVGIDVKYMAFNVRDTSNARIVDCSVSNVFGEGGFKFDGSDGIEFVRCEASRVYSGSNGDGFNAHSSNTGDAFAHQTTAILIDCWSHDNSDDGVSLHERSEFTVIGGLFEQNMFGGGVTPANGSHCTCYNVYSRDNGDGGFLYMNATSSAEGGVGGQIKCIGCVSESNNINPDAVKGGYKVMSAGNKAVLVSCKAINEPRGYYVADNDGAMILIDCGAYNCETVKGGKTENISVQNTTVVV